MAQLISNVLMQPKPTDAVERPLTLVEKLQAKVDRLKAIGASQDKIETASECLNIAQQHSDWISVDERLPSDWSVVLCYGVPFEWDKTSKPNSNIFCAVYVAEYDRWSVGYSAFGDTSTLKVTHWQPLPQPPREPQYLISKGGYWYRPNAKGYTASKNEAGRFSKEFAERHAKEVREVRIFEDKENR